MEHTSMLNCKPIRTPADMSAKFDDSSPCWGSQSYQSLIGALHYLTFTGPDIVHTVQQICLYMHDPREPHLAALECILRYIRGTTDYGLQLDTSLSRDLIAYSNVDWADSPVTRRSTSYYCVFLGHNLLYWSSKCQGTISRSCVEAEYHVFVQTSWMWNLHCELYFSPHQTTLVYCDNMNAVYISSNPVQHQQTNNIEIDLHFVWDKVATGQVRVLHVPSSSQYADILMKSFQSALFLNFRSSSNVWNTPSVLTAEDVSVLYSLKYFM